MVLRVEHKNELIRSFNALKELYECEFVDEENLFNLLSQVAENMYNYNLASEYSVDQHKYDKHLLHNALKKEKTKATTSLLFHKGSFL